MSNGSGSFVQQIGTLVVGTIIGMALMFVFLSMKGGPGGGTWGADSRTVTAIGLAKNGSGYVKFSRDELQPGDRIRRINGIPVDSGGQAYRMLQTMCLSPMETISVDVLRADEDGKVTSKRTVRLDSADIDTIRIAGVGGGKKRVDCGSFTFDRDMLYDAAADGNTNLVSQILSRGGKKYIDDLTDGETPLIAAVRGGHVTVAQELIRRAAKVSKPGSDGMTPLMRAAEKGNREMVAMLLAAGADPTQRNSALKTAAEIADANGFSDLSGFIDQPRPTGLLTMDQRRKAIERLNALGELKGPAYSVNDEEFGNAIKRVQGYEDVGMPQTGMLTASSYDEFMKKTQRHLDNERMAVEDETTQRTLSRVFTHALTEHWTPVDSASGYPDCNRETVLFKISPDQRVITWASFRPGVSASELQGGKQPTQEQDFRVIRAKQIDGYDTIFVRPDPAPHGGPKYQLWEIRDSGMKVTLKSRDDGASDLDDDSADLGGTRATKYASAMSDRVNSASDAADSIPGSYLMQCK